MLYVVHAEVLQDVIRIISAWRATAHERRAFAGAGEPGGPSLAALWEMPELGMDAEARAKGMNLHQAMRAALLGWIRRTR